MQRLIKSITEASTLFDKPRRRGGSVHRGNIYLRNGAIKNGLLPDWVRELTKIEGSFSCVGCYGLKSLEGMPEEVTGDFACGGCIRLKSLEYAPKIVGGNFDCSGCFEIKDFKGVPEKITGDFTCNRCRSIRSFETAPKIVTGNFIALGLKMRGVRNAIEAVCKVEGRIKA